MAVGNAVSITLSIRNVSGRAAFFVNDTAVVPEVWVRNDKGVPARLAPRGVRFYGGPRSNLGVFGSEFGEIVRSGSARGYDFPLSEYFVLDNAARYTIVATKRVEVAADPNARRRRFWLVARPLVVDLRSAAQRSSHTGKQAENASGTHPLAANEPADKDWTAAAAKAGKPVDGFFLEAIDSPVAPGKAELVVSLVCETATDGSYDSLPEAASIPTNYRLLLRDSAGKSVRRLQSAPSSFREESRDEKERNVFLHPGYAIGAMIPLREYFEMERPGEYWVMASLPSPKGGRPNWVAEPVKVRVDVKVAVPKK